MKVLGFLGRGIAVIVSPSSLAMFLTHLDLPPYFGPLLISRKDREEGFIESFDNYLSIMRKQRSGEGVSTHVLRECMSPDP